MYRQFFVDGTDHPKDLKPTFYGDSRAHWDGDTLVVDTVSFFEKSWYDFAGTPHTKQMHLTEKFHRSDLRQYGHAGDHRRSGRFHEALGHQQNHDARDRLRDDGICLQRKQSGSRAPGRDIEESAALQKSDRRKACRRCRRGKLRPLHPDRLPTTQDGKVDFSGVWVPTSTQLPGDPSYQPWAKKIYDERKANKGKDDPERVCLPNGAVRINPLPYKIVQRSETVALLWEGNTHSYRRFFLDGRATISISSPRAGQDSPSANGKATLWSSIRWVSTTKPGWTRPASPTATRCILIERYRRPDLGHLNVDLTIEDPKAFTKPYTFTRVHARSRLGTSRIRLSGDPG